jgi:quercetin dioxygenase-like cupin family protein
MKVLPKNPAEKGGTDRFVGEAWLDLLVRGDEPSRIRALMVHFAPGARTVWHHHAVGQTLHVTEGIGRIQARGGDLLEIRAGDTVHTAPGEWHWHGAAPDRFMSHLALYEAPDQGPEMQLGDRVSDAEYHATAVSEPPLRRS